MRIAFIDFEHHTKVLLRPDTFQSEVPFLIGDAEPNKTLGQLSSEDHLVIIGSDKMYFLDTSQYACKISVVLAEPPAIHFRHYIYLRFLGGRFHRILTHNTQFLKTVGNAIFLPYGTTWITDLERDYSDKSKNTSLIASNKRRAGGHKLRHQIVKAIRNLDLPIDIMGRGYNPFEDKADALAAYRFSVVIENSRSAGYFSEKIIDSMICETVPIYWGAPDISHFFDPRGLIICNSKAAILDALTSLSKGDYDKRRPYLLENKRRALTYLDYYRRVAETLTNNTEFSLTQQVA